MRKLSTVLCLLSLVAGPVLAAEPQITVGPAGPGYHGTGTRNTCQFGFNDTNIGSGWTLGLGQQLGIQCGGGIITSVGFYSEFVVQPGPMDVVINGTTVATFSTEVPGVNTITLAQPYNACPGPACIMLCPQGNTWLVTGEDYNSAPYGNSYFSTNCTCQNAFTDNNLTIWANFDDCGGTPTQETSWGQIRMMYR